MVGMVASHCGTIALWEVDLANCTECGLLSNRQVFDLGSDPWQVLESG